MAIELQTNDSTLAKASVNSSVSVIGSNGIGRTGGAFNEVLSNQASLFNVADVKGGLNTAKLLSPDVAHANQLLSQPKTYSQSSAKSIQVFEVQNHKLESILALKNIVDLKSNISNDFPKSVVGNFGQLTSSQSTLVQINAPAPFSPFIALRNQAHLAYKLDQYNVLISNASDESDDIEVFSNSADSGHGEYLKDSPKHDNPRQHSHGSDEFSPDELVALGALAVNSASNGIENRNLSTSNIIKLRMQSAISSPNWMAELAEKTMVMFGSDKHTAVIILNSSDTGSLKIILHVKGEQVSASFHSNDSNVLNALQMGFGDLKLAMLEAGLILSQLNINSGSTYCQNELSLEFDHASFDGKEDRVDMHLAKVVNFYV